MPIHSGENSKGYYFQWGNHGAKYYFDPNSNSSIKKAHAKSMRQAKAIYSNGYRGK